MIIRRRYGMHQTASCCYLWKGTKQKSIRHSSVRTARLSLQQAKTTRLRYGTPCQESCSPLLMITEDGKLLLVLLFIFGVRFLYQSLQKIIERYTYIPDYPSVTRLVEPPKQPFSRRAALTFLGCCYAISLTLGSIFGYWADDGKGGPFFDNWYLINIFLLPPIAVFIIHLWRFFVSKLDEVFDL